MGSMGKLANFVSHRQGCDACWNSRPCDEGDRLFADFRQAAAADEAVLEGSSSEKPGLFPDHSDLN